MSKNFIPSLVTLRAFEATARHASFTRAATELNITQAAVSQSVKSLEEHLGVTLFLREGSEVKLTEEAQAFLSSIRQGLDLLSRATESVIRGASDQLLTINSPSTFIFRTLLPMLGEFRSAHPEIAVRITAVTTMADFDKSHDVAIKLGHGDWPGLRIDKLFDDIAFPVCSPLLMQNGVALKDPLDLRDYPLIRSGTSFLINDAWPLWLEAAGIQDMAIESQLTFEFLFAALEAAKQGLGVAMGRRRFVEDDVEKGILIKPFNIEVPTGVSYFLTSPIEASGRAKVRIFREWLLSRLI